MENQQVNLGDVNRSAVAIGSSGAVTNNVGEGPRPDRTGEVADLLARLVRLLPEMPLEPAARGAVRAEIVTAHAQLSSPRPRHAVIDESLRAIRALLDAVPGDEDGAALLRTIDRILAG